MASSLTASRSFGLSQSQSNYALVPRAPQQPKPAPVDLAALQNASRILYDQFAKDAQIIPDLGETLTACTFIGISRSFVSELLDSRRPSLGFI